MSTLCRFEDRYGVYSAVVTCVGNVNAVNDISARHIFKVERRVLEEYRRSGVDTIVIVYDMDHMCDTGVLRWLSTGDLSALSFDAVCSHLVRVKALYDAAAGVDSSMLVGDVVVRNNISKEDMESVRSMYLRSVGVLK